jgi:hypothetical protein
MQAQPWLAVTEAQALRFFFEHLRDVSDDHDAPEPELLYNASVLAHFATSSTVAVDFPGTPASLGTVFDLFVLDRSHHVDPEILEAGASQCLLLTGFFGAQMKGRYNLDWYATLGASFFSQAAITGADRARSAMMHRMSVRFSFWRKQQERLAKELYDLPKLVGQRR